MQPVHYDLDKVERDIRDMFEKAKGVPRSDGRPLDFLNQQQAKTCDLVVAFMRWQLQMEMEGAEPGIMLHTVGVILADLAQNVWSGWELQHQGDAAHRILQGFCAHTNQVMQREQSGVPADLSRPLNPVVSGRA